MLTGKSQCYNADVDQRNQCHTLFYTKQQGYYRCRTRITNAVFCLVFWMHTTWYIMSWWLARTKPSWLVCNIFADVAETGQCSALAPCSFLLWLLKSIFFSFVFCRCCWEGSMLQASALQAPVLIAEKHKFFFLSFLDSMYHIQVLFCPSGIGLLMALWAQSLILAGLSAVVRAGGVLSVTNTLDWVLVWAIRQ